MVQVVDRVGALLHTFSDVEPELSLGECAERSGLSKSSAHRLLVALAEIGLVERLENSSWRIGGFAVKLAAIRLSHVNLHTEVAGHLRALGLRFEAATAFSVPNGDDMIYIQRTDSPLPFAPNARLGSRAPMWAGAAGRAVLSALDPDSRAARLSTDSWEAQPDRLKASVRRDIEEASVRGYAVDRGQFFEGVAGVAVALGRRHEPVAAISLIVSLDRLTSSLVKEMGRALLALAKRADPATYLPADD
jgi:DNA-binding IclR family transcriptional regulator